MHPPFNFHASPLRTVSIQQNEAPTTRIASALFRELCYQNKGQLQAGIIVAGWDKYHGGEVYSIPLGGSLHKQPFAIGGNKHSQLIHSLSTYCHMFMRFYSMWF